MTDIELLSDLHKKCKPFRDSMIYCTYFEEKLFKKDRKVFRRRTFKDLFIYYRRKGVTEKQLMRVLGDPKSGFATYICSDLKKHVFLNIKKSYKCFYNENPYHTLKYVVNCKYTTKYLEDLYDSVYK